MFDFLFHKCHESQADRVLELLKKHKWEPVSLPMLLDIRPRIAHHTECIRKLRDRGYKIDCKSWFTNQNGKKVHCSQYTFHGIDLLPRTKHDKATYNKEDIKKAFNAWLALEAPNAEAYLQTI